MILIWKCLSSYLSNMTLTLAKILTSDPYNSWPLFPRLSVVLEPTDDAKPRVRDQEEGNTRRNERDWYPPSWGYIIDLSIKTFFYKMPTSQNCVCKPDLGSKFSAVSRTTIFSTVVLLLKLSFNFLLASTAWWMLGNWSSVSNITCLSVSTRRNFSVFQKHAKPSLTCPAFRLKTPTNKFNGNQKWILFMQIDIKGNTR